MPEAAFVFALFFFDLDFASYAFEAGAAALLAGDAAGEGMLDCADGCTAGALDDGEALLLAPEPVGGAEE